MKITLTFVRDHETMVAIWTAMPDKDDTESVQEFFNRMEALVDAINKVDAHYHNMKNNIIKSTNHEE